MSSLAGKFWGYIHTSGSVHIKPFMSDGDLIDAATSPFVYRIFGPASRERVELEMKEFLGERSGTELEMKLSIVVKQEVERLV